MKKLKLNLDDLKVESFEISANHSKKGTVVGHADDTQVAACPPSQPCSQYGPSCVQTCFQCQTLNCYTEESEGCTSVQVCGTYTEIAGSCVIVTCAGGNTCGSFCESV